MFNIFKTVIETGRFDLTDMLKKIDTNWVQGKLTDQEKTTLITMAQNKAAPEQSVDLMKKIYELEARVKALEEKQTPDENTEEYLEYVVGKWYYNGNKITFDGKKYKCVAPEGVACVWSPTEYPTYWQLVE